MRTRIEAFAEMLRKRGERRTLTPAVWRKFIIGFAIFLVVTLMIKLAIVISRFHLFGF